MRCCTSAAEYFPILLILTLTVSVFMCKWGYLIYGLVFDIFTLLNVVLVVEILVAIKTTANDRKCKLTRDRYVSMCVDIFTTMFFRMLPMLFFLLLL